MGPEDLELAKVGAQATVEAITKPFGDLIMKAFGPLAEEVGQDLKERYHNYRLRRSKRLFARTEEFLFQAQIDPRPVPPAILISAIENGSIQDDDDLQDRWAALLANMANPDFMSETMPVFLEILRQLSGREARLLDLIYAKLAPLAPPPPVALDPAALRIGTFGVLLALYTEANNLPEPTAVDSKLNVRGDIFESFNVSLNNLSRLGVLASEPDAIPHRLRPAFNEGEMQFYLTALGYTFVRACRPPTAKNVVTESQS